jgi:hypothetical protein
MSADMVLAYLDFVAERHKVWEARQAGLPQPWTKDKIIQGKKFTNVFRVLDHGSQFLLAMLQDLDDPRERLARAFLYRHTGRPETWEYLDVMHGGYPLLADLDVALEAWKEYRDSAKRSFFTNAYLVYPQSSVPGTDKIESIIKLTQNVFDGPTPKHFFEASSQHDRFHSLRENYGVSDFMSMQILTDWGYTAEDRENEFVVAGPGAVKGAKLLFPNRTAEDVIRWAQPHLSEIHLPNGRTPSLMDVQNTLCEFSKYARYIGKTPTSYRPAHPGPQPDPLLPSLW